MKSIRRHLTVALVLGFAILLGAGSLTIYFVTRAALLHEFDAGLRAGALSLIALTEQDQDQLKIELPENSQPGSKGALTPEFFQLWASDGTIVKRSESLGKTDLPNRFRSLDKPRYWNLDLPEDVAGRAIGLKFSPRTENKDSQRGLPPEAFIVAAADREALDQTLATLAVVLLTTGLVTLAVTVPLVKFSLRRGHAPLEQLARQAAGISADSLQTRFPVNQLPEELLPITARLNDLLGRLEAAFQRERRFSADLAHELRTPLAELRSHAEVELAWPEGEAEEKHRETLNITLQMEGMVTRLLEMARCENGKILLQVESVPVEALLEEIWRPLARKAQGKQLVFAFKVPPELTVQTDRALFRSILANLLSNAVEYAPENGMGEIRWEAEAAELTFSNTVQDLNAADLPHLFERLWRKDKSRTGTEHCGLGLALSQTFAQLLGFALKARLSGERTLIIYLTLRRDVP